MNSQKVINNTIRKQFINLIEVVYSNRDETSLSMDVFVEEFHKLWNENDESVKTKTIKKKTVPDDESRCIASKKDGNRCGGRRSPSGVNPLMCSLHNKMSSNVEIYSPNDDSGEDCIETTGGPESIRCGYVFTKGKNKGDTCGNLTESESNLCKSHMKPDNKKHGSKLEKIKKSIKKHNDMIGLIEEDELIPLTRKVEPDYYGNYHAKINALAESNLEDTEVIEDLEDTEVIEDLEEDIFGESDDFEN